MGGERGNMKLFVILVCFGMYLSAFAGNPIYDYLTPTSLRITMDKNMPKIKGCYSRELSKSRESFSFKSLLKFDINENGKTKNIKVTFDEENNPKLKRVASCVKRVLKKASFPKPIAGGEASIKHNLRFHPEVYTSL